MAQHIVFAVHGMGQHYNTTDASGEKDGTEGWADEGIKQLKQGAKQIGYAGTFDDDYKVIPISYSAIFDMYLEEYTKQTDKFLNDPSAVLIKKVSDGFPLMGAVMKLAKKSPNQKNFFISHFGDVILYACTHFGGKIREKVRNDILKGMAEFGADKSWSVIGHSLGSTVVHDFLRSLYAKEANYTVYGKPYMFMAIGNVTELMYKGPTKNFYKNSRVFPSKKKKEGACFHYINGCHPLDPFTWLRHFDPPSNWGNGNTDERYHEPNIRSSHITHWNTHGFAHYLSHPRVQELFYLTTHKFDAAYPIDPAKVSKRMTAYEKITLEGGFHELKDEISKIKVTRPDQWDELAVALVTYYRILKKFTDK